VSPRVGAALEQVRQAAREASAAGLLPDFLGALEKIRAEVLLDATRPAPHPPSKREPDRVLSVEEAAAVLGKSKWWIYRNRHTLPRVKFSSGRYGFSARRLEEWIRGRSG
jgi:predicted DNA-binding transcriptional regulator AlpA